ncbi:N-acetyltransferase [Paraclostridium bifermentans]|jgi:putative acetyltransferase|uniref:N-acetyltransferase n=1 Tax=Paraclostridium bifermentans TaxID=1490 RepID=UPI00189DA324|nr:N-acetyltransferase [Paraclostridium bifermentans]
MIKEFKIENLEEVMEIWLQNNINAHNFIERDYWINNFDLVKKLLPDAKVYIFQEDNIIKGFIGVIEDGYIAGLFVKEKYQREGIGEKLIKYIKPKYNQLKLDVYSKNKNAIKFYLKNNFKIVNEKNNEDTNELEYEMIFSKNRYN